ncbi:transglycosylase domain-containing protein [Fodinicurvata fenggangensis]|uniref:transglycosylase domain-containing protein n=1 Tax=Fodinicurvata fenggangensis TaxID=1121830 RepID=UPI00068A8E29|nr:PBP1A family penicillin-binding protein [Fodinicurvata fenggangensis]
MTKRGTSSESGRELKGERRTRSQRGGKDGAQRKTTARPAATKPSRRSTSAKGGGRNTGGRGGNGGRRRGGGGRKSASRGNGRLGWLKVGATAVAVAAVWGILILGGILVYYAYDLPDVSRIADTGRRPSVQVVDVTDRPLAAFGEVYGEPLSVGQMPPHLPRAVLAIEDRRFYDHFGLDPLGLMRAAYVNLMEWGVVQGGSTLTQQLAKNVFLSHERTFKRKVQELLLSFWLERRLSKDQILALYMNRVYFGAGTYGVDAAAQRYFDKSAREVTLYEAALIAGLLRAPSRYSPTNNPELAHQRTAQVLNAMVDADYISRAEAEQALEDGSSAAPDLRKTGRYFARWAASQIGDIVGPLSQDVKISTTLDPKIQTIAEEEVERLLKAEGEAKGATQAAVVVMSHDGAIRAMVGGRSWDSSEFNRAVQARRQPGSAFKPFVYLAAFENGLAPDSRVRDAPVQVSLPSGPWNPGNYGDRYYGDVTLREAFARSLNSVAVQLIMEVGPESVVDAAERLGIDSDLKPNPSLALGTSEVSLLDLTAAYVPFANGGRGIWPYGVRKVTGRGGSLLYQRSGEGPGQAIAGPVQAAMVDVFQASVGWGTSKGADPGRPAGGKTGTTQESRDAWFVGFTAELVVGVWVGNDDNTVMKSVTGGGLPARLWNAIVTRALEGEPPRPLKRAAEPVVARSQPDTAAEGASGSGPAEAVGGFLDNLIGRLTGSEPTGNSERVRERDQERWEQNMRR